MPAKKMSLLGFVLLLTLLCILFSFDDRKEVGDVFKSVSVIKPALPKNKIFEYLLFEATIDTRRDKESSSPHRSIQINTHASNIDILKGTWMLSHVLGGKTPQTDKLVIKDAVSLPDGNIIGRGVLYLSQITQGVLISCAYEPKELANDLFEYFCVSSKNASIIAYAFRFSENRITRGLIGVAGNLSILQKQIENGLYEINGNRLPAKLQSRYQSDFTLIQWDQRGEDDEYCLHIGDDKGKVFEGLDPMVCGKNMLSLSPKEYIRDIAHITLPKGFTFRWWVGSKILAKQGTNFNAKHFGGVGYEGRVVVDSYQLKAGQ